MTRLLSALLFAALVSSAPALAQDAAPMPSLALELNAVQPADTGCRVTFMATNTLGSQLDRAAVEVAFFNGDGGIDRIVTLDFKNLPDGKTKVLQFELANLPCDNLGRLLINDITACEGATLTPDACMAGLFTTTRPDIVFGV